MTQFLKQTHFQPLMPRDGQGNVRPFNTLACGRMADVGLYRMQSKREGVDCPGCLAALRGKERRDAGSL